MGQKETVATGAAGFADRLRKAIGDSSANQFAKRTKVNQSLVAKYLAGSSQPGLENLVELANAAGVNLLWLATGDGPMTAYEGGDRREFVERLRSVLARGDSMENQAKHAGLPLGLLRSWAADASLPTPDELRAFARGSKVRLEWLKSGQGPMREEADYARVAEMERKPQPVNEALLSFLPDGQIEKLSGRLASELGLATEEEALFTIEDDAMAPTLAVGDKALIDSSPRGRIVEQGIFLIYFRGYRVRRVSHPPSGDLVFTQDNASASSVEVPMRSRVIGRVVGVVRKV